MEVPDEINIGDEDVITIFDGDDWVTIYDGQDLIWCDHPSGSGMWRVYVSLGRDVIVYEVSIYAGGFEETIMNQPPESAAGAVKLAEGLGYDLSDRWLPT